MTMATLITNTKQKRRDVESTALVRWVFLRGSKVLTCEVRASGERSYDVCVVPHWDVSSSIVEAYDRPMNALTRHAELAHGFRQAGWTQVRHYGQVQPAEGAAA
jgi:hypothetical protein